MSTCAGAGRPPTPGTVTHRTPRYAGRGVCQHCGRDYKLTFRGLVRVHRP